MDLFKDKYLITAMYWQTLKNHLIKKTYNYMLLKRLQYSNRKKAIN